MLALALLWHFLASERSVTVRASDWRWLPKQSQWADYMGSARGTDRYNTDRRAGAALRLASAPGATQTRQTGSGLAGWLLGGPASGVRAGAPGRSARPPHLSFRRGQSQTGRSTPRPSTRNQPVAARPVPNEQQ